MDQPHPDASLFPYTTLFRSTVDRTISVTLTGTNDTPVVASTDVTGAVTELVTPVGNLTDSGTLEIGDAHVSTPDTIVPPMTSSACTLGSLTASVTHDTTGVGTGGEITWNYSVTAVDIEYLAKDQTKLVFFKCTRDHGHVHSFPTRRSSDLTGTNDTPVVASTDVTGAVTELVTPVGNLTDSGTL